MFDKQSVYALNKVDKDTIVYPSATGEHIRLSRSDFSSDEEFSRWKKWSDEDYRKTEVMGQSDDRCLSLEAHRDTAVPSAEEVVLAPYIAADDAERRQQLREHIRTSLTPTQYRRMCLYHLEGKKETEIAALEGVAQQQISKSLIAGAKIVERILEDFLGDRV